MISTDKNFLLIRPCILQSLKILPLDIRVIYLNNSEPRVSKLIPCNGDRSVWAS
jgi:hypothetical protein